MNNEPEKKVIKSKVSADAASTASKLTVSDLKKKPEPAVKPVKKIYEIPLVIEPPFVNPRTAKPMKRIPKIKPKEDQGLRRLGGIFDIDNGWDKEVPEKAKEVPKRSDVSFPRPVTSPIKIIPKVPRKPIQFIKATPETFSKPPAASSTINVLTPPRQNQEEVKNRSKFDFDSQSDEDSDDEIKKPENGKKKLNFSDSEDESSNEENQENVNMDPIQNEPPMKRQRLEEINDNDSGFKDVNRNENDTDEDDAISLTADDVE